MPQIIHEISNTRHRLIVDNVPGEWVQYRSIAMHGDCRAVTQYFADELPEIFRAAEMIEWCNTRYTIEEDDKESDYFPADEDRHIFDLED